MLWRSEEMQYSCYYFSLHLLHAHNGCRMIQVREYFITRTYVFVVQSKVGSYLDVQNTVLTYLPHE